MTRAEVWREISRDVARERRRQHQTWGDQFLPNGTGTPEMVRVSKDARAFAQKMASNDSVTWCDILFEEVCEAFAEKYDRDVDRELVEVIAVAVAWLEDIRSRKPKLQAIQGGNDGSEQ